MSDLAAVLARATSAGVRAYETGKVPSSPATPYAVIDVDTGTPGAQRGGTDGTWFRIICRIFGQTTSSVNDTAAKLDTAFRNRTLTELPGQPFARRELAGQMDRDQSGGLLGLIHTYRY